MKDFILLKHDIRLVNKDSWTNAYTPNEQSEPLLHIDPVNLKNSPDFVLLYGINTVDCDITIFYDDNKSDFFYMDNNSIGDSIFFNIDYT